MRQIPDPVRTWLVAAYQAVRSWRPDLRSQRFWTQIAVITTYVMHDVWAGRWVFGGWHVHLFDLVTWWSFLAAAILVLAHRHRHRLSYFALFPLVGWAGLMGIAASITWIGFHYDSVGNGKIVAWGLIGIVAPLVVQALEVRSKKTQV